MRVIKPKQIIIFILLISPCIALSIATHHWISEFLEHPFYKYILALFFSVIAFYLSLGIIYRLYIKLFSFPMGDLDIHSRGESRWMVYSLFWLLFFYPVLLPKWIPTPITGLIYRLLGAKIGKNSFFSSMLYDPHLLDIGEYVLGGAQSLIIPHAIEGSFLAHYPIKIGNHVTIGANCIILGGVIIEDHVIIGSGSIIKKGTHIKRGEIWAGNPARHIKTQSFTIEKNKVASPSSSRQELQSTTISKTTKPDLGRLTS